MKCHSNLEWSFPLFLGVENKVQILDLSPVPHLQSYISIFKTVRSKILYPFFWYSEIYSTLILKRIYAALERKAMLFTSWSASWSNELQIRFFAVEATSHETFSTCFMSGYNYYHQLSWQTHCFHKPSVKDFINWIQVKIGDKPLKAFGIRGPQRQRFLLSHNWPLYTRQTE